jgi:hypothetical protein
MRFKDSEMDQKVDTPNKLTHIRTGLSLISQEARYIWRPTVILVALFHLFPFLINENQRTQITTPAASVSVLCDRSGSIFRRFVSQDINKADKCRNLNPSK